MEFILHSKKKGALRNQKRIFPRIHGKILFWFGGKGVSYETSMFVEFFGSVWLITKPLHDERNYCLLSERLEGSVFLMLNPLQLYLVQ